METRPTADRVKESLFNILAPDLVGCRFLDVFAGNGGVGLEALSRGAEKCVFVEKNFQCATIIKENLILSELEQRGEVLQADAQTAIILLRKKKIFFDLIFFDPPYGSPDLRPALQAAIVILRTGGYVVVEHQSKDLAWHDENLWFCVKKKTYGDTALSFMIPAAATVDTESPDNKGGEN
jgi:16S rRNA (guanine(966)-N(2))-methyltransferase RsmD